MSHPTPFTRRVLSTVFTRSSWLRVVILLTGTWAITFAGESVSAQTPPLTDAPIKTLLLHNGEMISGRVVADAEHFFVFPANGGQINLPRSKVAHLCDDATGAYQFLAAQVSPADTPSRTQLVEWCLAHHQLDAARVELDRLARVSRRADEIAALERRLIMRVKNLETLQRNDAGTGTLSLPSHPPVQRTTARPGQISPTALMEFTRHIQPLLINGCAAATCHGRSTTTEFAMTQPPRGFHASQRLTQRNLVAVLQQIDMLSPGKSGLLTMARTAHGNHSAVYGRNAIPAFRTILNWVESVSGPVSPGTSMAKTPANSNSNLNTTGSPAETQRKNEASRVSSTASVPQTTVVDTIVVEPNPELPPMDLLTSPSAVQRPRVRGRDPFDAEIFNATFGN